MAVSATQQRSRLAFDQSRRSRGSASSLNAPSDRGAALRMAQSLATGQRNQEASLDKQLAGEAGARLGQAVGAYLGGVGAPIGKRLGRVLGENWRIVLTVWLIWMVLPFLLLTIGALIIFSTLTSFFA
jgi:hypothetical protein